MEDKKEGGGVGIFVVILLIVLASGAVQSNGTEPESTSTPKEYIVPEGVDIQVWEVIIEGVYKAGTNGVECDPYILYALQEGLTSPAVFCDETWEDKERPNDCASYAGALGMWQFLPETFMRNAKRHNIEGSLWNPNVAAEVACYFIHDEVHIDLEQPQAEFVDEFARIGGVWNTSSSFAAVVYERGNQLKANLEERN
jgi:hypothetical protein